MKPGIGKSSSPGSLELEEASISFPFSFLLQYKKTTLSLIDFRVYFIPFTRPFFASRLCKNLIRYPDFKYMRWSVNDTVLGMELRSYIGRVETEDLFHLRQYNTLQAMPCPNKCHIDLEKRAASYLSCFDTKKLMKEDVPNIFISLSPTLYKA